MKRIVIGLACSLIAVFALAVVARAKPHLPDDVRSLSSFLGEMPAPLEWHLVSVDGCNYVEAVGPSLTGVR